MLWFLCAAFVLIGIAGRLYAKMWKKGLSVRIRFSEPAAYAGESILLEEIVSNHKKMPLPQVEAAFRLPKGLVFADAENIVISDYVYKRDLFSLRGMEQILRKYTMRCEARGRYSVSQVIVRTKALLHGREYILEADSPDGREGEAFLVYAGYTDISAIEQLCDNLLGMTESRNRLYEDPFLFSGIRDYRRTDPMNRINWKAMARTGSMMVNTFSSVQDLSCMIFLDVEDRNILKEEDLVEESIRAAASLCRRMILHSQMTGLAVNTDPPVLLGPERGRELLSRVEYALTENFTAGRKTDFLALVDRTAGRGSRETGRTAQETMNPAAVYILISKNLRAEEVSVDVPDAVLVTPVRKAGGGFELLARRVGPTGL